MNKMVKDLMFSSDKDDWGTPWDLYNMLNKEFHFTLDACATLENAKHKNFIAPQQDALKKVWRGVVFCNPPYSKPESPCAKKCKKKKCKKRGLHIHQYIPGQRDFIIHGAKMAKEGLATVVFLLPARTDSAVFHDYVWDEKLHKPREGVEVRFLRGRVKFHGAKDAAPFPSMVVVFHNQGN